MNDQHMYLKHSTWITMLIFNVYFIHAQQVNITVQTSDIFM